MGTRDEALERFDEINERLQKVFPAGNFLLVHYQPGDTICQQSGICRQLVLPVRLPLSRGGLTVGQLSCFLSYANQYTKPFNEISGVVTELQNALACAAACI